MSDVAKIDEASPKRLKRISALKWATGIVLGLLLLLLVIRLLAMSAWAHHWVENRVNSLAPIRGQTVKLSGLTGDLFKTLNVETLSVRDAKGEWLSIDDADIAWSPLALLARRIDISNMQAARIVMERSPELGKAASGQADSTPWSVNAPNINLPVIEVGPPVYGTASQFKLQGGVSIAAQKTQLTLSATRTDKPTDMVDVTLNMRANIIDLKADLKGGPGGLLANLLRSGDKPLTVGARLKGDRLTGDGAWNIEIGDSEVLTGQAEWADGTGNMDGVLKGADWALLIPIADYLGKSIDLSGQLSADDKLSLTVKSDRVDIVANAFWPVQDALSVPDIWTLKASSSKLGKMLKLPDGVRLGSASVSGEVRLSARSAVFDNVLISNLETPWANADKITGPVTLSHTDEGIRFDTRLKASDFGVNDPNISPLLSKNVSLSGAGLYALESGFLTLSSMQIDSGDDAVRVSGDIDILKRLFDVSGQLNWRVSDYLSLPNGQLKTKFSSQANGALPVTHIDGNYVLEAATPGPTGDLLGLDIGFVSDLTIGEAGISFTQTLLITDRMKAAANGSISDIIDVDIEAVASGDIALASGTLHSGASLTARLEGQHNNPQVRVQLEADEIEIGGRSITSAVLKVEASSLLASPQGLVAFSGAVDGVDSGIHSRFQWEDNALILTKIDGFYADIMAKGELVYRSGQPITGGIVLAQQPDTGTAIGETGAPQIGGELILSNSGGVQGIKLTGLASGYRVVGANVEQANINLSGTLEALSGNLTLAARRDGEIKFETPVRLTHEDNQWRAVFKPSGQYRDLTWRTERPWELIQSPEGLQFSAGSTVNNIPVTASYEAQAANEVFSLKFDPVPLQLIALPALVENSRGSVQGSIELKATSGVVDGYILIQLKDWRGEDYDKGSGLSLTLKSAITNGRATWAVNTQAGAPFNLTGAGELALMPANKLWGLGLNESDPILGRVQMDGAAASVLSLMMSEKTELGGTLGGDVSLSGTALDPLVNGRIAGRALKFEAPEMGTQIRAGEFDLSFTNDSLTVTNIKAQDAQGGSLNGDGILTLGPLGRPLGGIHIKAQEFTLIDRADILARLDSDFTYTIAQKRTALSGSVRMRETIVREFKSGGTAFPTLDVREINRPKSLDLEPVSKAQTPIYLDVAVKAPKEIYVRSRGLDVELSVDAQIKGTHLNPEIFGEADLIRGRYKLAGRELAFDSGKVTFSGELSKAELSLKASTESGGTQASIEITGTVAKPELKLTSTPELPQDEILAHLLFEKSVTDLSAVQLAQLAGALAQFTGGGGFNLLGGLQESLGISQLDFGLTETGNAQISGGRYIGPNVYLQVFTGAGDAATGTRIHWKLTRNLSLLSSFDTTNARDFEMRWEKEF